MTGKLYIDGIDAYSEFRVFITDGGYKDLVCFPALKPVETVDWPERDGIEADLANPVLESKTLSISFGCSDAGRAFDFHALLAGGAYHSFDFRQIEIVKDLRLVSVQDKKSVKLLDTFTLQFADDFPLRGYVYEEPDGGNMVTQKGYRLDDRELSDYGVWVLAGSNDEIEKTPAVKLNLLTANSITSGAVYDGQKVVYQAKDVTLKCCARAASMSDFWRNHNALLYNLIRPGERQFYYEPTGEEYPCYYKNSSVPRFTFRTDGDVWCEFSLTLVFTSFRIGEVDYLLASEDDELVITEDGEYYINLG